MSTKELILKEIEQIPEPYLGAALEVLQTFRKERVSMFKGRPLLRPEDTRQMDDDLPPEPEWDTLWDKEEKK